MAPYRVEIADVEVADPRDGEALVRSECSGISGGSEMLAYRGELDSRLPLDETLGALTGTFAYPFAYGYSSVGIVERSSGEPAEGTRVFAFHPHQDVFVVGSEDAIAVGDLDPRLATLYPLVETAVQVSLDAGVRYAENVAVLGLGPLGSLVAHLLGRSGARVVASEPKPWRRDAARAFGVDAVAPDELDAAVAEATGGRGVDFLVEASGNADALGPALDLLMPEGVALVASWYGTNRVALPLGGAFHRRRLDIRSTQVSTIGSRSGRWDRRRRTAIALELLRELPLAALATHDYAFERAAEAYAAVDRGEEGLVHAALVYG